MRRIHSPSQTSLRFMLSVLSFAIVFAFATVPQVNAHKAGDTGSEQRIVSIGGSVTEILYALGYEESVVAVDTTSVFPPEALKDKPNVGYMRRLSAEGILALNPTKILAIEGAGPPDVLDVLQKSSVPVIIVPNDTSAGGVIKKVRFLAGEIGAENQADALAAQLERDFQSLADATGDIADKREVLFALNLRDGQVMASGADTAASGIISLAGAKNAVTGFNGYKPLSQEAVIRAAPEAVLVMERRGHNIEADDLFSTPAFIATPAAADQTLFKLDGAYMLGFGPRTPRAARDLGRLLYPDMDWPELESDSDR
ncbi:MAG: ABC transporter substrate-binding protein [Pseudomonadota bacterium]